MPDTYDSPWKELLERFFPDFLAFFFPEAHQAIDWAAGYESLDKELAQVVRDAASGDRIADKLIKVHGLDASQRVVLIHTELQNESEAQFEERMFVYSYRIYDRYRLPVVSLAVLGDDRPEWRPRHFGWNLWGCRVGIRFPTVKLIDFDLDALASGNASNPMAWVVEAHLATRATRHAPFDRLRQKLAITRRLVLRGLDRSTVLEIYRFIDWVLALPPELERQFWDEHQRFEERHAMRYVTNAERFGLERGLVQGREEGLAQGAANLVERLLDKRFGPLPKAVRRRVSAAPRQQLEHWAERVLDAPNLEAVFEDDAASSSED